jgi:hypothetical protein
MMPNARDLTAGLGLAVLVVFTTWGTAGCLCPCPNGVVIAAPVTTGGGATAAAAPMGGGTGPVASGNKLVIWDGDGAGTGAQGWDACDGSNPKNGCSKVATDPSGGVNGSTAIKLRGDGAGWIGMGWNLFGWYPLNAGIDLTPYTKLTFQIRVDAKSPEEGPDPSSVGVLLGCSSNKNDSATVTVERYAKGFADGKWHKVEIPIAQFVKGGGSKFDLGSFWEFRVATWSAAPRHFSMYIDDITAEK